MTFSANLSNKFGKTMGGFGSGRRGGARTTDECLRLDIKQLQREGLLKAGISFTSTWSRRGQTISTISVKIETGKALLTYSYSRDEGAWESLSYPVQFQTTPCNYGGVRYWFTCPTYNCGKRVVILYLGGKYFACRHCCQLAYSSQRDSASQRLINKADKLRKKLNWEAGVLNGGGWKPKGMHWATFRRLMAEHDRLANAGIAGLMAKVKPPLKNG